MIDKMINFPVNVVSKEVLIKGGLLGVIRVKFLISSIIIMSKMNYFL